MEGFASIGGMLPEQIWDEAAKDGLELGGPSGSAMPLAWAHSEYLKLLRSARDGEVFDRIPIVEARYARGGRPESCVEIFQPDRRRTRRMAAGKTLRISAAERFRVRWTSDGWRTHADVESRTVGYAGWYADLATEAAQVGAGQAGAAQTGVVSFTLYWPDEERWEGTNFEVELEAVE
jgi:glucoamylase